VLVDTRSATDFTGFHIDGAMNISPSELRSKTFLIKKSVVLMGNGKAEREQYIDCKRLKSNGFKQVKVLHGGMPSWLASGQAVLGLAPNIAQLTRMTPSELWIESQFESNLVLVTSSQKVLQSQLKNSVLLSDENPKTIQKAIENYRKHSKSEVLAAVVLVSDKGQDFQTLIQTIKTVPLLVYYETAEAFAQYVAQQNAVWMAQARGPKQPSGCKR
jgi:rhodanese-related sulfurtransferase